MLPRVSKVECQEGDFLLFSTEDQISNVLFRTGKWDDHLLKISRCVLTGTDAPLVMDIGANLGAYAIPMAKHVQSRGGSVIAFEPQRIVYYQLCGNVILNRLDNCHAIHGAVGAVKGTVEIPDIDYERNRNIGAFSLDSKYRELHGIETSVKRQGSTVPLFTLDEWKVEKAPSLIKLDVEGYELSVLKGGRRFLEDHGFPPFLFEAWHFDWYKEQKRELLSFVESMGYRITNFGKTDHLAQHPAHPVQVGFVKLDQGGYKIERTK